jgi:hypothetical protein
LPQPDHGYTTFKSLLSHWHSNDLSILRQMV